jgi:hypothetical protein
MSAVLASAGLSASFCTIAPGDTTNVNNPEVFGSSCYYGGGVGTCAALGDTDNFRFCPCGIAAPAVMTSCAMGSVCLGATMALPSSLATGATLYVPFASQNGSAYTPLRNYFQALAPPPGHAVVLNFSAFDSSPGDAVSVYTSTALSALVYGPVSGAPAALPSVIGAFGNTLVVKLAAESGRAARGIAFNATLIACPAGSACAAGALAPAPCSVGAFALAAATACTPCPAGYACARTAAAPVMCASGTAAATGALSCGACSAGTSSNPGASSCSPCPANFYSSASSGSCSPCPAGATSLPGSASCATFAGVYMNSCAAFGSPCIGAPYTLSPSSTLDVRSQAGASYENSRAYYIALAPPPDRKSTRLNSSHTSVAA